MQDNKKEVTKIGDLNEKNDVKNNEIVIPINNMNKISQEQIHDLLFSEKLSWQAIIYDLINTEQLDPWDIDLVVLTSKYFEKIRVFEEANFFISSKVLFAAALLLRIKSDILLNADLQSLDDILFGRKEDRHYVQERIELDEEIPGLVARTPLPRFRKVTLAELMASLGKAIATENRRIKKVVLQKQYEREAEAVMPKHTFNLKDKVAEIYPKLLDMFEKREEKLQFSAISGNTREERIYSFVSLLHLDNQQKIWLEQEGHFDEIWILLKHLYDKKYAQELEGMKKSVEEEFEKLAEEDKIMEEKHRLRKEKKETEKRDRSKRAKKAWKKRKQESSNGNIDINNVRSNDNDLGDNDFDDEDGDDGDNDDDKDDKGNDNENDEFKTDKVENYEDLENKSGFSNPIDRMIENELDED